MKENVILMYEASSDAVLTFQKLTRVINRNIEKEMIEKAEKERKGVLGVVKPNESGGANLIQYRKELKKKGTKRR